MKVYIFLIAALLSSQCISAQDKVPSDSTSNKKDTLMTFSKVEFESEFPGGTSEWINFLNKHLKYPGKAIRKGIQGEVRLQFIVCTDGTVCNIEAISGPEELRASAIEAFKKTPNWIPATQNGKKVKSYKRQSIFYKLSN